MIWMELLGGLGSVLAIIGVMLNNRKLIACFPFWMISNAICLAVHTITALHGDSPWSMLVRDVVFLALAFDGYYRWRRDKNVKGEVAKRRRKCEV